MRAWVVLAIVAGCGADGSSAPPKDAGSPDAGCAAGEAPIDGACRAPGVPADACATGFASDGDSGCVAVLPAAPCGDGTLAVPGESTCHEVAPCGDETWAGVPMDANAELVDGAYQGGGSDGSASKPWTTIQAAVDAAAPGAVVGIAAGTYTEDVVVAKKAVRLWGRCPAKVEIVASAAGFAAVFIQSGASGAEVHHIAMRGPSHGVGVSGAVDVALDGIWVHDTTKRGIDVEDAFGETKVAITGSLVERAAGVGVFVSGAEVSIESSVVRDGHPGATAVDAGRGVDFQAAATSKRRAAGTIRGSIVERNLDQGVVVAGADALLEAVLVRDTGPRVSDMKFGRGVSAQLGQSGERSTLTIRGAVIERSHDDGIAVNACDTTIEATTVRDTLPQASDQKHGRGISVGADPVTGEGSTLVLRTSLVEKSRELGLFVGGADATVDGLLVRDTSEQASDLVFGDGVVVQRSSKLTPTTATFTASRVERSTSFGVLVYGATATFDRVAVVDTKQRASDGTYGDGVAVMGADLPASAELTRSRVEGSARASVSSFGAHVAIGDTVLACDAFHLDAEPSSLGAATFDDQGGNTCGCGAQADACKVVSASLSAPAAIED